MYGGAGTCMALVWAINGLATDTCIFTPNQLLDEALFRTNPLIDGQM